ncbi:MAG: fasciclin domain-containing protein [Coleofasciculaceae cyanobacterium]
MGVIGLITLFSSPSIAQKSQVEKSKIPEISPLRVRQNHHLSPNAIAESPNLLEQTSSRDQFRTLTTVIKKAGLEATMAGVGPYTVFAPTDEAFAELPQGTLEELLQPENKEILVQLLGYHITWGKLTRTQLQPGEIKTIGGASILVRLGTDGTITVNNSKVTQADIPASNGVIHAVDQLILPPDHLR